MKQAVKWIRETKEQFRILKDWEIHYNPDSKYKGQCFTNVKNKTAVIYAWG